MYNIYICMRRIEGRLRGKRKLYVFPFRRNYVRKHLYFNWEAFVL